MMLQIGHRESHDVDIFLPDPQLLSFLDPQKQDFKFNIPPSDHSGDGTTSLKLAFKDVGQIDFIVDQPKTTQPTIRRLIEEEDALLETLPEIIAKKIVHRGKSIKPRDIFDIAAAGESQADAIVAELKPYKTAVTGAIETIDRLNTDFVNKAISQLMIKERFGDIAKHSIERAKKLLKAV